MSSKKRANERREQRERRQKITNLALLGAGLVFVAYFVYITGRPAEPLANDEILAMGAEIYTENCIACHGEQGEGHVLARAPALDGSEHAWHHADGNLQDQITQGGVDMPGFGDKLTTQEIQAVVRYFQTWWSQEQIDAQQKNSQLNPFQN